MLDALFLSIFLAILPMTGALAQDANITNLTIAWRLCEQHGKLIGRPSLAGPARWVFQQGYGSCEAIQKLVPTMRAETLDPNQFMSDQMLIEKALQDPNGNAQ